MQTLLRFLLFSLIFPFCSAHALTTHVIELQNYPTESFLETIEPVLLKGETATVVGQKIILNTDQATLDIIKSLVIEIDKPLRNLLIRVRSSRNSNTKSSGYSVSGTIGNGDIQLSTGSDHHHKLTENHTHITLNQRTVNKQSSGEQEVRSVEGYPAFINTGQAVPVIHKQLYVNAHGNLEKQIQTGFKDVMQGFFVTARLIGNDRVSLSINYNDDKLTGNSRSRIDTAHISTTLNGRVGEWINLGGIQNQNTSNDSGIFETGNNQLNNTQQYSVQIIPLD